ncbi:hypothetical protein [Ekhidna sp.]
MKINLLFAVFLIAIFVACDEAQNELELEAPSSSSINGPQTSCSNNKWALQLKKDDNTFSNVEGSTIDICNDRLTSFRYYYDSSSPGGPNVAEPFKIWHPDPNASAAETKNYFQYLKNLGVKIRTYAFHLIPTPENWIKIHTERQDHALIADFVPLYPENICTAYNVTDEFEVFIYNPTSFEIRIGLKKNTITPIDPVWGTTVPSNESFAVLNVKPATEFSTGPWDVEYVETTDYNFGDWQQVHMKAVYKGCGNPSDASFYLDGGLLTGIIGGPIINHSCVQGDIQFGLAPNTISYSKSEMDGELDFSLLVGCHSCLPDGCIMPCWRIEPILSTSPPISNGPQIVQGISEIVSNVSLGHWVDNQVGKIWALSCY